MAGNIKITSAGSTGTTTLQSSESADRTLTLPDATGSVLATPLVAGTNTAAPLTFSPGVNLTTAAAGAIEFDGNCFYSTPVASARGLSPSMMFAIVPAGGFALQTAAGVQSAFPTATDVWTLAASTSYWFDGLYWIQEGTNSVTVAMAFALAGGASVTSILYSVWGLNAAANTTGTSGQFTIVNTVASTVVNAASTTNKMLSFNGIIRINAAGTVTPQINFSGTAAGTPTMLENSYIRFTPLGTNTVASLGNVG